jgi:phage N-6-adenine-methyltransferase
MTEQMIRSEKTANKDLWETPPHIFNPLNSMFQFTLDPCCTEETAKCPVFFTPKEDGLKQSWAGHTVFANPPYSRGNIDLWVMKFCFEAMCSKVIALLPVSTSSDWFQKYILGNTIYWVDKRIRFVNAPYTAPFSSMIVHFNGIDKNLTWTQ